MQQQKSAMTIWLMWALASFFYAYQYILRVLPNIMMSDILERFHIHASTFGQFSGLYYIGYAAMHIPIGILLDKYGPKRVLPLCILLTVVGLLPLLYAENWIYPGIGRLLIGMGSSAAILGVFKIIRISFPEDKFTVILGFSVTIGLIGAIYGGAPVNYVINTSGVQPVLKIIILIGVLLAFAMFIILPKQTKEVSEQGWMKSVKEVFSNSKLMMICILAGFMVGPLEGFADVWGKEYLKTAYNLSDPLSASLPSLIFFGMCFGAPVLSWLAAKTKSYFGILILSAIVMGGSFVLLLTGKLPVNILATMFVVIGVFYKASTYVSEHLVSLTTASANMIIMIFGYFFHSLIGKVISLTWDGQMTNGIPFYDVTAYTQGLTVIPAGLFLAALGYMWIASRKAVKIANGVT